MSIGFKTPILFIVFNRPDTTILVFDQIKKIRPKKLFIAADGPRPKNCDDIFKCFQVRQIIKQIDWECEVFTLFRDENLGCGKAVSSAISWFFEHVEYGIILEDDCLPDESFFEFCSLMLDRYRFDENVMMIGGTNFLFNKVQNSNDYFFSRNYLIWGWVTWKRAWDLYDFELSDWKARRSAKITKLYAIFSRKSVAKYWQENFDKVINKKVDTWDYQWAYCCIFNDGFSLNSICNLVSNIGAIGAHGSGKSIFVGIPSKKIDISKITFLTHVKINRRLELITYKNMSIVKPFNYMCLFFLKQGVKKILRLMRIRR